MIRFGYLGGVMQRESVGRLIPTGDTNQVSNARVWSANCDRYSLFLTTARDQPQVFTIGPLAILVRGYMVPATTGRVTQAAHAAEAIARHYLEHGDLPADHFEGSFTVTVLDRLRGRSSTLS